MEFTRIIIYLLQRGIHDIALHKYVHFFTYIATTLIIFMCGLSLMLITTVDTELQQVKEEIVFHVYWKQNAPMQDVQKQWLQLDTLPNIVRKETFTPKQAYELLEKNHIPPKIIDKKKQDTILPPTASIYVSVRNVENIQEWIENTKKTLSALPYVENVFNSPFKDKFVTMWNHLHRYVIIPITILLFFSLALVIGNTVALSLHTKRSEVEILHLVGAPTWYILAPLTTIAFILGISGSLTAIGLLWGMVSYFKDILILPPLLIELQYPSYYYIVLLLVLPPIIGIVGTWIAVRIKTA